MSRAVAQQHLLWLHLAEHSGPFLSLPALLRAFPQGLEKPPRGVVEALRDRRDEWRAAIEGPRPDLAVHRQWCRFVLRELLRWPDDCVRESGTGVVLPSAPAPLNRETLGPDLALLNPSGHAQGDAVRLLVQLHLPAQALDEPIPGRPWRASPVDRMVELLRGTGIRLGVVTNGEQWQLVSLAPEKMPGLANWDVDLWFDERVTLEAFSTLLEAKRFFSVAPADTLEALFDESAEHQHEVTDQLGKQVRRAVEVLVQAIDQADRDAGGELLKGVAPTVVYEAALTVMMRLVFLFSAEERGLIGQGVPLYDLHHAVSTLREQLQDSADQHGEETLETRHDAWVRLLATFRLIHGGASHEDLSVPAYGGSLFDPDRFTFLEGRPPGTHWRHKPAEPLPVSNRTVLHLLSALQVIKVNTPGAGGEVRRLSFRSLDIENIGHVYEGLLDHTALRASLPNAPILGLVGKSEPEIPLPTLEGVKQKGEQALIRYLKDETGKSAKSIERALAQPVMRDEARALRACGQDAGLYERVKPWLGMVRDDTLQYPIIVPEGSVYVTAGVERRSTGTYYTPRSLTEPIVRHALEPVVFEGPAEGLAPEEWRLRPPDELLSLRVCDFAMGSGAFLVQACRYLAERLVEAWEAVERGAPAGVRITPEGERSRGAPSERLIPVDADERRIMAMRLVADRCLYGVDKNPMAVEMAKLSLWLATLQRDRPFNFLDHALRAGDSLLGVSRAEHLEFFDLQPAAGQQITILSEMVRPALAAAGARRRELESFPVLDIADAERKAALLAEADAKLADLRAIADLLVGCSLAGQRRGVDRKALVAAARERVASALDVRSSPDDRRTRIAEIETEARHLLDDGKPPSLASRQPFHWALEFPEVFERGGFDAMVANPPFQGGQKITGSLGTDYRDYLVQVIAAGRRGSADLAAYFMLRVAHLLRDAGTLGMIATNTIAQGATREVGLEQLLGDGFVSPRAVASQGWPGGANLEVAVVWLRRGEWDSAHVLDGAEVPGITPFLTAPGAVEGKPFRLVANAGKSFQGSIVLGMGFVLEPDEAQALIARDPWNRKVLFPYLNGEDLNSRWDQSPSRWVINFQDWPLDRESAPARYVGPVAADFPDCLRIVEERVRPGRARLANGDATARDRARRWWQFARQTMNLYAAIADMVKVLVVCRVTHHLAPALVSADQVFADRLYVFSLQSPGEFAVVQSSVHDAWARKYSSTFETRLNYSATDCFETFPFPPSLESLRSLGDRYDACRRAIMTGRKEGLTATYNRFHSEAEHSADVVELRELHVEMDRALAAAYGWSELDLGHDFHQTRNGLRFTLSEKAHRDVLGRLLKLNHDRYAEEVAQGLHDVGAKRPKEKSARRKPATPPTSGQTELL